MSKIPIVPIESPEVGCATHINKKDVGFCTPAYPSLQALALPPPQDKQRISPRRVYIQKQT